MKRLDLSAFKYEPAEETGRKRSKTESPHRSIVRAGSDAPAACETDSSTESKPDWPGPLPPLLEPGLRFVFVGFNPGTESGRTGHYYAHHSNRFWKMLHWSGLTPRKMDSAEDRELPGKYRIGFTDLVARTTKGIQQLSKQEMADGVDSLDARIGRVQPQVICFVGKGIWETVAKARGWDRKQFQYGLDPHHSFGLGHSKLCCVPSTSGLNSMKIETQLDTWREVASLAPDSDPGSPPASPPAVDSPGSDSGNRSPR